jgi:integrase
MEWIKIIRPPHDRTLPGIRPQEEVHRLINSLRKIRYRVFLLVVSSVGLRIAEGLGLEAGDIDGSKMRVQIRNGKGGQDRYVPLPSMSLLLLSCRSSINPATAWNPENKAVRAINIKRAEVDVKHSKCYLALRVSKLTSCSSA